MQVEENDDAHELEEEEEDLDSEGKPTSDGRRRPRPKLHQYKFVSSDKRQKLIQLIEIDKMGIKEASSRLGLNYSTAKSILRKYRHTGKILSLKNEFLNDYENIYHENERIAAARSYSFHHRSITTLPN